MRGTGQAGLLAGQETVLGGHLSPPQPRQECPSLCPQTPITRPQKSAHSCKSHMGTALQNLHLLSGDDPMNGLKQGAMNARHLREQVAEPGLKPRPSASKSQILSSPHCSPFFEVEITCTVRCLSSMVKTCSPFPRSALENLPGRADLPGE